MSGVELRERDLGQLLGHILEVSSDQFGRLFMLQAVCMTPVLVAQLILRPSVVIPRIGAPPEEILPLLAAFYGKTIIILLVMAVVWPIQLAAATFLVRRLVDGEPPSLGACLREAVRVWPRSLLIVVTAGVLIGLGLACCIVPGMVLTAMFFVALQPHLLEGTPWTESFARCRELVGGLSRGGRLLEVLAVYLLMGFAPGIVLAPVLLAVALIPSETAQILIGHLVTMTANVPMVVAVPLVYYHLRVVKEALDVDRIADLVDVIGASAPGAPGASEPKSAPPPDGGAAATSPPPGPAA